MRSPYTTIRAHSVLISERGEDAIDNLLSLCTLYSLWHPSHGTSLSSFNDCRCHLPRLLVIWFRPLNPDVTAVIQVGGGLVNPRAPDGFVPKETRGYQLLNARYEKGPFIFYVIHFGGPHPRLRNI